MNQDGYTLVEMTVALLIISLAVGGLVAGLDQLGRLQSRAAASAKASDHAERLQTTLARFLADKGPFRSDDAGGLAGDSVSFSFACGAATASGTIRTSATGARLILTGCDGSVRTEPIATTGSYAFTYEDDVGEETGWPPKAATAPRTLRGIALIEPRFGETRPIAQARMFAEQPAACAFDAIARTCRPEGAR